MGVEKIYIGTLYELANKLLEEYINKKEFTETQINYSPKEDYVANGEITAQSKGKTLTLFLSDEKDEQIENIKVFSDECINGFTNKILRKGQVYQLTFIFAYIDKDLQVKCQYPSVSGNWAEWENYWQSNTPDKDCIVYAAVNLLVGESLQRNATIETLNRDVSQIKSDVSTISRTADNTYIFDVAELKSKSLLSTIKTAVTETGDEAYPYAVEYTQMLKYGNTNATGELISNINADLGIKYYRKAQWEPTVLGGCLDVLYVGNNAATGYPHRLQDVTLFAGSSGSAAISNVELRQSANVQFINIRTIVKFPTNPTETNINDIQKYLNGEANSKGHYIKKIYIRIEVPALKEVSVL
ncbi:MAG TPA: hypothetical protein VFD25_03430 [Clostridia bacterium]|nr:hypothetical protein [Clostridia bacterium]